MILLDLFSGIGGFHLGLKMAGFKFSKVYWSEIDEYSSRVYRKRFPDAIELRDITKITGKEILGDSFSLRKLQQERSEQNFRGWSSYSSEIFMCGGFPCQDISVAGNQKGIHANRSGLFSEIIRLACILRPQIIFLENVPNLISGKNGEWFLHITGEITRIGYDCWWDTLSASSLGARHKRKRVWIVAYSMFNRSQRIRRKWKIERQVGLCSGKGSYKKEIISNTKGKRFGRGNLQNNTRDKSKDKQIRNKSRSEIKQHLRKWEVEPNVGRVAYGIPSRMDRLKGLGNSVVPQCVAYVADKIIKQLINLRER